MREPVSKIRWNVIKEDTRLTSGLRIHVHALVGMCASKFENTHTHILVVEVTTAYSKEILLYNSKWY